MITDVSQIAEYAAKHVGERSSDSFFRDRDGALKRPTRAKGGEPCAECGGPIDPKANWKTRDRWLCGKSNCSRRVKRRYARELAAGTVAPAVDPAVVAALTAEWLRPPQHFGMNPAAEFPFEFGRWPKVGDTISRFGHDTVYVDPAANPELADDADYRYRLDPGSELRDHVLVRHAQTGVTVSILVDPLGQLDNLWPVHVTLNGEQFRVPLREPLFRLGSYDLWLSRELITDVDEHGNDFRWEAMVFTPAPTEPLWTPARTAMSQQRARVSAARGAFMARARAIGNEYDEAGYIDPSDVYVRDEWMCGICGSEIDPTLAYPEPFSASLDHITPVSVGGAHADDNVRAAHLICNIRRGNRA